MNDITIFLGIEDENLIVSDISVNGNIKEISVEKSCEPHFCPICGNKMHSRGIKVRTVRHPILQDGYQLVIKLKQRRWRCINSDCGYDVSDSFKFVERYRQTTNATDIMIVSAFKRLNRSAAEIGHDFNVSDHTAIDIFDKYVNMKRLKLSSIISIDEVYLNMDSQCKYVLVIQDFFTGEPIDLVISRQTRVTEPYFRQIPYAERCAVKYLISDMYNPYICYSEKYFPNAVPVVDSFHVMQWIISKLEAFLRKLLREFKERDYARAEEYAKSRGSSFVKPKLSDEVYLLQNHKWVLLKNVSNIDYSFPPTKNLHFGYTMDTYSIEDRFMKIHEDIYPLRNLKEEYVAFNLRNAGNPVNAAKELDELIEMYQQCGYEIFNEFAVVLKSYRQPIINSFILAERIVKGEIVESRLSNGPMESLNRKAKDLKRTGRGYTNFNHLRNRFLFATRKETIIQG